jgi:hypothetical protein
MCAAITRREFLETAIGTPTVLSAAVSAQRTAGTFFRLSLRHLKSRLDDPNERAQLLLRHVR